MKTQAETAPEAIRPGVIATENGWYILIKVQPGAKQDEFRGCEDGRLKIRLAAPAVESKANQSLIRLMAERLGLRKNKIFLAGGAKSREKKLFVPSDQKPDWNGINSNMA
ncbi:MAG: DUF167 domain-containing protein [Deltaproteobacteria bacterium]|jgi:uncharacterized protein (TIGR00251 family)|nr:DUF167 domain-containing protein [Deltaproteobacteria bacterium]